MVPAKPPPCTLAAFAILYWPAVKPRVYSARGQSGITILQLFITGYSACVMQSINNFHHYCLLPPKPSLLLCFLQKMLSAQYRSAAAPLMQQSDIVIKYFSSTSLKHSLPSAAKLFHILSDGGVFVGKIAMVAAAIYYYGRYILKLPLHRKRGRMDGILKIHIAYAPS